MRISVAVINLWIAKIAEIMQMNVYESFTLSFNMEMRNENFLQLTDTIKIVCYEDKYRNKFFQALSMNRFSLLI